MNEAQPALLQVPLADGASESVNQRSLERHRDQLTISAWQCVTLKLQYLGYFPSQGNGQLMSTAISSMYSPDQEVEQWHFLTPGTGALPWLVHQEAVIDDDGKQASRCRPAGAVSRTQVGLTSALPWSSGVGPCRGRTGSGAGTGAAIGSSPVAVIRDGASGLPNQG
jgi:hypothetical protein